MILYHYYYLFGRLPFEILVNRHNTFQMLEFPVRRPGRPRFPSLVRRQLYSLSPATTWRTLLLMPLRPRFRIPTHTKKLQPTSNYPLFSFLQASRQLRLTAVACAHFALVTASSVYQSRASGLYQHARRARSHMRMQSCMPSVSLCSASILMGRENMQERGPAIIREG